VLLCFCNKDKVLPKPAVFGPAIGESKPKTAAFTFQKTAQSINRAASLADLDSYPNCIAEKVGGLTI